jgi:hypothetical protein
LTEENFVAFVRSEVLVDKINPCPINYKRLLLFVEGSEVADNAVDQLPLGRLFLGASAPAYLSFGLQLPVIIRAALCCLLSTFFTKRNGCRVFPPAGCHCG